MYDIIGTNLLGVISFIAYGLSKQKGPYLCDRWRVLMMSSAVVA